MLAHEDLKDKKYEVEMTWITGPDGPTGGRHQWVPRAAVEEALQLAKRALEDDDEDEAPAHADARMEE